MLVKLALVSSAKTTEEALDEHEPLSSTLAELNSQHRTMSVQILRLETLLEDIEREPYQALSASYVKAAIVLRDLLVRASGVPNVLADEMPSFDHRLSEAVLWAYRWAVVQLSELRQFIAKPVPTGSRSIPLEALSVFHDLSDLCAASGRSSDANVLVQTLRAVDDTLYRLIELRDRIEHVSRQANA
jgi:hypothetical protein